MKRDREEGGGLSLGTLSALKLMKRIQVHYREGEESQRDRQGSKQGGDLEAMRKKML